MKKEKQLAETQAEARAVTWPNEANHDAFVALSRNVRDVIVPNLELQGLHAREMQESWQYRADIEAWQFELTESIAVEVGPGRTRHGEVREIFHIEKTWVTADIKLAISMVGDEIKAWRAGLREMRKLQLQRVLTTEGADAYEAAAQRE